MAKQHRGQNACNCGAPPVAPTMGDPGTPRGRDAFEGKGSQRRPRKRLDRRLQQVAKAVGGCYCGLQMPNKCTTGRPNCPPNCRRLPSNHQHLFSGFGTAFPPSPSLRPPKIHAPLTTSQVRVKEMEDAEAEAPSSSASLALGSDVERWQRHVEEELLTQRCPRCRAAYADYEGCTALLCGRCGCHFCAWCQQDCGNDAHPHVMRCEHNPTPRELFTSPEVFERARTAAQRERVRAFLEGLAPPSARAALEARIRPILVELGLAQPPPAASGGAASVDEPMAPAGADDA